MPYSYPTTPGVTYAVECAAEVFVTNPQTGAVAVSGDGSATVYFTATDTLYDISDDSAKVQPLFKHAPRLKLTLLQGVAGGWLPKGYTELEYLESSGTQYIDTGICLDTSNRLDITGANTATHNNNINVCGTRFPDEEIKHFYFTIYCEGTSKNVAWYCIGDVADMYLTEKPGSFDTSVLHTYSLDNERFAVDGETVVETKATPFVNTTSSSYLFARNGELFGTFVGLVTSAVFYKHGEIIGDFVPALRDADGVAGLFDRRSKQFFENIGTGRFGYRLKRGGEPVAPMSLRDPWRVAPSGVYARLIAENELEIVADTEEPTGEGWEWFENTAEAYEYFGINQDELLTE